jgi:hypothetical protein
LKAKATGQLKPGEYEKTRADIYQNTDMQLPSTVRNVVGNHTDRRAAIWHFWRNATAI